MSNNKIKARQKMIERLKSKGLNQQEIDNKIEEMDLAIEQFKNPKERQIHFIFQILSKNKTIEELNDRLGKTSDCEQRSNYKTGVWHYTLHKKVKFGHFEKFINEILDEFESQKEAIKQLKKDGDDIVILDLSEPKNPPQIFGLSSEIMTRLGEFGIGLNIPPPHYLQ